MLHVYLTWEQPFSLCCLGSVMKRHDYVTWNVITSCKKKNETAKAQRNSLIYQWKLWNHSVVGDCSKFCMGSTYFNRWCLFCIATSLLWSRKHSFYFFTEDRAYFSNIAVKDSLSLSLLRKHLSLQKLSPILYVFCKAAGLLWLWNRFVSVSH